MHYPNNITVFYCLSICWFSKQHVHLLWNMNNLDEGRLNRLVHTSFLKILVILTLKVRVRFLHFFLHRLRSLRFHIQNRLGCGGLSLNIIGTLYSHDQSLILMLGFFFPYKVGERKIKHRTSDAKVIALNHLSYKSLVFLRLFKSNELWIFHGRTKWSQ